MSQRKVLVIEDDEDIIELITYNLKRDGYIITTATSGEDGLRRLKMESPSIILLDLMLPGIDGLEVCRTIKGDSATKNVPVIMLTAKGEDADIVTGLEMGADDYMVKPFSPRVLLARIKTVLRRKTKDELHSSAEITFNNMCIHPGRHEVVISDKRVDLTYTEFALLYHLAARPGWVFSRYQIVEAIRGDDYPVTDRSVDVTVVGLRKKLGSYGEYIKTVRGVGYKFVESEDL